MSAPSLAPERATSVPESVVAENVSCCCTSLPIWSVTFPLAWGSHPVLLCNSHMVRHSKALEERAVSVDRIREVPA